MAKTPARRNKAPTAVGKHGQYRIAVYPGTFDPITNGHIDIISRACKVVDKLVVGVAVNVGKGPLFSLKERVEICEREVALLKKETPVPIEIVPFEILLMEFVKKLGATMIIRGLRAVSDFEYEFQMAGMNARLDPRVETMFLMASERNQFISSRFVKEIASLGGDISSFVPQGVLKRIRKRYGA
ncbi:MAG: pantetheine-phosphate adenylyltransferase [Rhodospirillaceae bacterium]|nr:MAG: pantetheine-phosphate adenylyltransferase [Rhodospirillaceae bacterium]